MPSRKRVVILGAGVAGTIAYGALRSYQPKVFDAKRKGHAGLSGHQAIMRLRDPNAALLMGCGLESITAYKSVLFKGQLLDRTNITINNLYSRKVSGHISERSLKELGKVERYLISVDSISPPDTMYGSTFAGVEPGPPLRAVFKGGGGEDYDICISTVPMPVMLKCLGLDYGVTFEANPIFVMRATTTLPVDVHQTIYVPESGYSTYRATLEGNVVIFEAMNEYPTGEEVRNLLEHFGLSENDITNVGYHEQSAGKMEPIDDSLRRLIILELTQQFNIYSFGRYAIWKPIRIDHLMSDIEKIQRMMLLSEERLKYESHLA